ncbi:VWA domain-containing protein [Rhodoblastus sp.]|uniref:vWA domain-containing protein n=1 Tax=Rhodoblastus sp. TaxID=1962975 RepID=UPI0035AF49A9
MNHIPSPHEANPLLSRLFAFIRDLRENGFVVGLAESQDSVRILCALERGDIKLFRDALRGLVATRREDWERFDALFDAFWLARGLRGRVTFSDGRKTPQAEGNASAGAGDTSGRKRKSEAETSETDAAERDETEAGRGRASAAESLFKSDFRHLLDPKQMERASAFAERLSRLMRTRLSRRDRAGRHGRRLDFRRVIHRNIGHGGAPVELVFRRRRRKPLKLILLLDSSGSMDPYTPFFLRFAHGALSHFRQAAAFLFHTRLVEVTSAIRDKDRQRATDKLALLAQGVGGGTRIGECLAAFNARHAQRAITSRSAVMIVSDGFETAEPDLLKEAMRHLRRRCRRIVWLNPLLGRPGYEPKSVGMNAALPFVDLFAPAHNLASLAALESYLAKL